MPDPILDPSLPSQHRDRSTEVASEVIADNMRVAIATGMSASLARLLGRLGHTGPWVLGDDGTVTKLGSEITWTDEAQAVIVEALRQFVDGTTVEHQLAVDVALAREIISVLD